MRVCNIFFSYGKINKNTEVPRLSRLDPYIGSPLNRLTCSPSGVTYVSHAPSSNGGFANHVKHEHLKNISLMIKYTARGLYHA